MAVSRGPRVLLALASNRPFRKLPGCTAGGKHEGGKDLESFLGNSTGESSLRFSSGQSICLSVFGSSGFPTLCVSVILQKAKGVEYDFKSLPHDLSVLLNTKCLDWCGLSSKYRPGDFWE